MSTTTTLSTATTTSASATASCTTAVPDKYGYVPIDACNANYAFYPNFGANLAFAVLFGMSTIIHLMQAIVYKKRYCWVVIMGATWELAGFAIKTVGSRNQQNLQLAIYGQLFFLLAPLWINAFAYMTVARMIYFRIPEKKIWGVRAIRMGTLFIWLDVICFIVQLGGGVLLSNNDDANLADIGKKLYMAGVGVQLAFVLIFIVLTGFFYRQLVQLEGSGIGRMRYLIWTMLAVLILVVVRIVFRLYEFSPGANTDNPILTHEDYALCLDALPMLFALVVLNVMHPGLVLRGPDSDFPRLSRKEKKALKAQKKEDKRQIKAAKKAGKSTKSSTTYDGGYEMYENIDNGSHNSANSHRGLV
ncbi:RTA1 domain protein [Dactylonectria estremocensis]|uniref:RTA1 domain protein n=1 Tax=Dactylonectria estremocensis TaxID=1079267 RepID=A0A9P9J6V5_9HYPO|nr:RTA1 domain protein [Dactylonectria estremocensis]